MEYLIKNCSTQTFDQAADLSKNVFNDDFLSRDTAKEESFSPENVIVLEKNNTVVCMVCVLPRQMRYANALINLHGIGSVATHPEHRGKGYASQLMQQSIHYMHDREADLSILFAFSADYYNQFGYQSFQTDAFVLNDEDTYLSTSKAAIKTINIEKIDWKQLNNIYNLAHKTQTGVVLRDLAYWKRRTERLPKKSFSMMVAEENGSIKAYALTGLIKKNWNSEDFEYKVFDYASLPGEEETLLKLLFTVKEEVKREGRSLLFLEKFNRYKKLIISKREGSYQSIYTENLKNTKMYKIINLESLLKKITPVLFERVQTNWQDYVNIHEGSGDLFRSMKVHLDFIKSNHTVILDEAAFIQLLLGKVDLLKDHSFGSFHKLSREELIFFAKLFPKEICTFSDYDYL